jgi:glucose-1-phosphatase
VAAALTRRVGYISRMEVTGILFDLGGVICGFDRGRRLRALAEAAGRSPDEVSALLYDSGFVLDCDLGRLDIDEMTEWLRCTLGISATVPELAALWASAFELDERVLDIVRSVRPGRRMGLLTNNDPLMLAALPQVFPEISHEFDCLLFSCVLRAGKPSAQAFSGALDLLGTAAAGTVFVDDSIDNVAAAAGLGLQAVQFSDSGQLSADLGALGV